MKNQVFLLYFFIVLLISGCSKVQHLAKVESSNLVVSEAKHPPKDSAILAFVEPYRIEMESLMGEIIGRSETELVRMQPDGPLNRVVADMIHQYAASATEKEIDFAVQNYFGLRTKSLPKGEISLGLIYELMPFENYLVILEVPGSVVQELCDLIAAYDGWPISHGLSFGIKDGNAHDIMIGGKLLDIGETYKIATNDYLANGGDEALFFREYRAYNTGILLRDAFIDYIRTIELKGEALQDNDRSNRIYFDAP